MFSRVIVLSLTLTFFLGSAAARTNYLSSHDIFQKCNSSDCANITGCITVYQHTKFRGWSQCIRLEKDDCVTLNRWWISEEDLSSVSSVDPHGTCVRLYNGVGCRGPSINVYPGSPSLHDLGELYFGDRMVSASTCDRAPQNFSISTGYAKCTSSDCSGKKACATVYQNRNYGGWYTCVTFREKECVTLDQWWRDGRVSSVDTNGTCVRLYEGIQCNRGFLEVNPNNPHPKDLGKCDWNNRALSVGTCDRETVKTAENYSKCITSNCTGNAGCVTFQHHQAYSVYFQCITFQNDECVTMKEYWNEGRQMMYDGVFSVDSHGTCIRLYDRAACNGAYVQVGPNNTRISDLKDVSLDRAILSVSSCQRPILFPPECYIQKLFSRNIKSDEVSEAALNIRGIVLGVTDVAVAALSEAGVVGLNTFYTGIKFALDLFQQSMSTEALIEAKIDKAFSRNAASEMVAEIKAIRNRISTIFSSTASRETKLRALSPALHSCEKIKALLEDDNYSFSQNKVASGPCLVAFSSIYLTVATLAYQMRNGTNERNALVDEMNGLVSLNERFLVEGIQQRKESFVLENMRISGLQYESTIITDTVVCSEVGSNTVSDCWAYRRCYVVDAADRYRVHDNGCDRCLENIKRSIEIEYEQFFRPVINDLKRFPELT